MICQDEKFFGVSIAKQIKRLKVPQSQKSTTDVQKNSERKAKGTNDFNNMTSQRMILSAHEWPRKEVNSEEDMPRHTKSQHTTPTEPAGAKGKERTHENGWNHTEGR